jgi:nicotinamide mononucleotide transporter
MLLQELYNQVRITSPSEYAAVITSLLYVYFATKQHRICWVFAFISTVIYSYIFIRVELFLESGLQVFYVIMAIYGYFTWNKNGRNSQKIRVWSWKYHIINISLSTFLTYILGYIFATRVGQESPYLDAFTTVFSIAATFMVAYRVLENWVYWIVIDSVSVYLYQSKYLYLSALLMLIFTLLAVKGLITWRKFYKNQLA